MRILFSVFAAALVVPLLSGCAWKAQHVTLQPRINIEHADIGQDASIIVRVIDSRVENRIGYRGIDSRTGEITSEQDMAALIRAKLVEGLAAKGFRATSFAGEPGAGVLKIELRSLTYSTDMESLRGVVTTRAELFVSVRRGERLFERPYSAERTRKTFEALGARENERMLNEALAEAIEHLLKDDKLLYLLAT
jgi:uncharacterized lipoprotein